MTIAALLEAVAARDPTAFSTLVDQFDKDLVRLAFVVCGDRGTAEDAAQATWERLWREPPRLRAPGHLKSWLPTVAANEARAVTRRGRRGREIETQLASAPRTAPVDVRDTIMNLDRAMVRLTDADREVLGRRSVLDLSAADIATLLGPTEVGARVRLHRAILKLRLELADDRDA